MPRLATFLKILLGLLGVFLGLIVVSIIVLKNINWNNHRSTVAGLVERHTDYQVQELGYLDLGISLSPHLTLSSFKLTQVGRSGPLTSLTGDQFEFKVSLLPYLFRNELHINHFKASNTEIILSPPEIDPDKVAEPTDLSEVPVPFLRSLALSDITIIYEVEEGDRLALAIDSMNASSTAPDQPVQISGQGHFMNLPWNLEGEFGSLQQFTADQEPYPLNLLVRSFDDSLSIGGYIEELSDFENMKLNLAVNAQGDSLQRMMGAFELPLAESPPAYNLSLVVNGTLSKIAINDISMTLGQSHIYGESQIDLTGDRPFVGANLAASLIRVRDFTSLIAEEDIDVVEVDEDLPLFPDENLPTELLHLVDGIFSLKVATLEAIENDLILQNITVSAHIDKGILTLDNFNIPMGDGEIDAGLVINDRLDPMQLDLKMRINNLEMSQLIAPIISDIEIIELEPAEVLAGRLAGNIELKSSGQSPRLLASNLDGNIGFAVEDGQIAEAAVEALGIDIPKAFIALVTGFEVDRINCTVLTLVADSGIINTETFLIGTSDYNISGGGYINLRDETINYRVETLGKDFSLSSTQSPFTIEGPLDDISVNVLTGELLARLGAAAIGALISPPLAIAPFVDLGLEEEGRCNNYMTELEQIKEESEQEVTH